MGCQPGVPSVGTDFSGLETATRALKAAGVKARLLFCCEKEPWLRDLIRLDTPPEVVMHHDVDSRDLKEVPYVDLYVAGPSCQSYSTAGRHGGVVDPRGRHLWRVVEYIEQKQPACFVVENVVNLMKEFSAVFKEFLARLRAAKYKVKHRILSSMTHGCLPHSRERLYVVGIAKDRLDGSKGYHFFPPALKRDHLPLATLLEHKNKKVVTSPCTSKLNRMLIQKAIDEIEKSGLNPYREPCIVDIDSSAEFAHGHWAAGHSKTITRGRGATGFYCTTLGRRLCVAETLRLQGFRPETVRWELAGVARTNIGKACGNAMSCSVLERLLPRVLYAGGLIKELPEDSWERRSYNPFK